MSFTLAALIVLAGVAIFVGLLAHNLVGRLERIESAVFGGMRPAGRQLHREEFGRRFAQALARADYARQHPNTVSLFVGPSAPASGEWLAVFAAMPRTAGFRLGLVGDSPAGEGDRPAMDPQTASALALSTIPDASALAGRMGITALPFCLVIDDDGVVDAQPVGSPAALQDLLVAIR